MIARVTAIIFILGTTVAILPAQSVFAAAAGGNAPINYAFKLEGVVPGGHTLGMFESCVGMGSESEIAKSKMPADKGYTVHYKRFAALIPTDVVCSRSFGSNPAIWEWRRRFIEDPDHAVVPSVFVVLLDQNLKELARWELERPWPTKVTVYEDGQSLKEQIVLASRSSRRILNASTTPFTQKPPTPPEPGAGLKLMPKVAPKIKPATGYQTGVQDSIADISGHWRNNAGQSYDISQQGPSIGYDDPILHQKVTGSVNGRTVTVSWQEGTATRSVKGTVTSLDSDGKARRIEWENGIIFER